jgi:tRNA 2-thiouridine synthesizing protein A
MLAPMDPPDDPTVPELLDCRGELCPVPVARTRLALRRLPAGGLLRVWCTDPMAPLDIAALCAREGYRLLQSIEHAEGHIELLLQQSA